MAEDRWESSLYECRFGGEILDVQATEDDISRSLVPHTYPHRDGADVEDTGGQPRTTHCRVIFFDRDAEDDHYARFVAFAELVRQGKPQRFVHPITGTYQARVGDCRFSASADERARIMVEVDFIEHTTEPAVFEAGAGTPVLAGVEEIAASSADLDSALEAQGLSSSVGGDVSAAVAAWEEGAKTTREINLEVVKLSNEIAAETERLELATQIKRYPIMVSMARLHHSLRRAASAFVERSPRIIEITVTVPTPLLVIAARYYGGEQATSRYEELLRLNPVRNPARIEAGTRLKAYSPNAPRTTLRLPR